ncbi:GGDEF domain-containing protein [Pseudoxanthomonas sp. F37]|uniref:GGDEF domain-containing protein n=1 Tax=Pseudoxanthomonas TaxID=83618 RepID=UPI001FCFD1C6|nr:MULTISPECIES: GGDEF domain-containing protein [Pseudoxanthomonas]UOV05719.1 GGDEF domain-containing protein [Pseudoxanthomonas mexicana]UOV07289.1 GGDEF domain-containing protein [Pseudoxanthomonas sp. F37]
MTFFRPAVALVFFSFVCASFDAGASDSLTRLLEQAETARSADPAKFRRILERLNEQAGSATESEGERIQYLNAYSYAFQGKHDLAIDTAKRLFDTSKDPDMRFRVGALIVNAYAVNRQFTEGLRQLEQTLGAIDQVKSKALRHQGLGVAALINSQIGQHEVALKYALNIQRDSPDARTQCLAKQVELESLQYLGRLSAGQKQIVDGVNMCAASGEMAAANLIRITLAKKMAANGDRSGAIALLQKYLPEMERTRYPRLLAEVKSTLAELMLENGNAAAAERYALDTIAQSASLNTTLPLVKAYRAIYEIADRRGDSDAALAAYRNYAEADKAYLNEVKARELAYQIVRQETLQKTQQINLLDQQNQVLQLQRKVDQQAAQNNRLIVMLLIVLVASIGYWAFKIKRVQLSLKKMAETDALTGICNRHHFTIRAERALAECARNGEQAALIMYDLDHFKNINDRFGHGTGDWALKEVAEASKGFCRRIDVLGRLGGEEFAILMYGCDLRAAARVAEDCRLRLAQLDTRETGHVFAITGSFGVTSSVQSGYSLAKLLSHADRQLYRAKHLGRNRVCVHENEHEHEPARAASNVLELPQRERSEHIGA